MAPRSRRQFVREAAVAAGAWVGAPLLRAAVGPAADAGGIFRAGITAEACARGLAERLRGAQVRLRRAAAAINARFPVARKKILDEAALAMRGMLLLPGSPERTFVGAPPQWSTPRYGDDEFLWSLNRMNHWTALLRAHALTGDDSFAEKVIAELDDWIVAAAPPAERYRDGRFDTDFFAKSAPAPWRSLEVGIRMYGAWTQLCEHLAGTKFLPPARVERMARAMALHAQILFVVPIANWPDADHNHFFMETLGLLAVANVFPELKGAPAWAEFAVRELDRCVANQFTPEGGHVEGCPNYHNICAELLGRFVALAQATGRSVAPATARVLVGAAEHSLHATRPTGSIVPWGDSFPGEGWIPGLLWTTKATRDPRSLQQMATVLGADRVIESCAAEIWEIDDPEDFLARLATPPHPPLARWRHDRGNDQVMLRSAWGRDALSVFFACHAPLPPKSGHQHIDLGGFDFCAFGRTLIADPGPFTYREGDDRQAFKSAAYHSVLTIDDRGPFEYLNRWRYSPQKEGRVTTVREERGGVRLESFHRNYAPALCRRTLALVDDQCLVVIDVVENLAPASTVQIFFHLDSTRVAWNVAARSVIAAEPEVGLIVATSADLTCELLPGRVSERFDVAHPSTRVRFSDKGGATRRVYASVLVPFRAKAARPVIEQLRISTDGRECSFRLDGREHRLAV